MMEKYGAEKELYEVQKKASFNGEDKVVAKDLEFDDAVKYLSKDANYEVVPQRK